MYRFLNGQSRVWFAMAVCSMALALQSCTSVEPDLVKQEDGYLYGYGKGGSPEEAELEAKRDLIANALESSMRKRSGESRRIIVTGDTARGMPVPTNSPVWRIRFRARSYPLTGAFLPGRRSRCV